MEPSFTRLVSTRTGETARHNLSQMPTYLAVSHAWGDKLFPPGVSFLESSGRLAITSLLESEEYGKIAYCWIDTLCIDQNDDEDKQRQIPLMGRIYGGAELVAIVIKDHLGLTQAKVNAVSNLVREAVEMSRSGSWLEHGANWNSSEKHRRRLREAMDMLEVFTRPSWGSRVWTMQEFILAKKTIWIGGDLQPLSVDEWLFQTIPDVCDYLSIEECLGPKYTKLYAHFQGMAGAHLRLIDPTRVMELLGNKIATVPEDEVYGLMAASGVVLDDATIIGKEKVWARWWEKAVRTGNLRWALLPPASALNTTDACNALRNCAMPEFSKRHLCSTNSALDTVAAYGPVDVHSGTVRMTGRMAGQCHILRRLGRVFLDGEVKVVRDISLCLFASGTWNLALRIASAFGAGRYSPKQRATIAQTLVFNYYRAKQAVMTEKTSSFKPRFRTSTQAKVWADFMLLQSIHMRVMNEATAFLAMISNSMTSTDAIVVTAGDRPSGDLWAIDFGAINESEKTMFTIVKARPGEPIISLPDQNTISDFSSLHKEGVSMYAQVTTNPTEAKKYASHMLEHSDSFREYRIGGASCFICNSTENAQSVIEKPPFESGVQVRKTTDPGLLRYIQVQMLMQTHELKRHWKKRSTPSFLSK